MTIEGDFNTLFLADVLQLLCSHRKTGVLKANQGEHEVKTFIKNGSIICVMGFRESSRLGNILVSNGVITGEQLEECLAIATRKTKPLGKILVDENLIEEGTLNRFIDRQAEDIILDMLMWEAGSFIYNDCDLDTDDLIIPHLNIMKILMQATRRIDEMSVLVKQISDDRMRFKLAARTGEKEALKLDSLERRVLELTAKGMTVREVIKACGEDEFHCYKAYYSLISSGLIEHRKDDPQRFEAEENRNYPVVKTYTDILDTIYKQTKPALGRQIMEVFDACKPCRYPWQSILMEKFSLHDPIATNVHGITNVLMAEVAPEKQLGCLMDTFNAFISNLLEKLPGFIGQTATQELFDKIEDRLAEL
ncbi:MAG: DUF4388 domain-containing protein [Deltaproteobacteria bacterium]|nr:DUF4388 domain-containing protein [Deltaproteobacteria bacterium]